MAEPIDIEFDPAVLAVLGRRALCPDCGPGVLSRLTWFSAALARQRDGRVFEVHSFSCSNNHWWSRRGVPLPEREQEAAAEEARPCA